MAAASSSSGAAGKKEGAKKAELVVNVKYRNTLPTLPFPPKFLPYPFDPARYGGRMGGCANRACGGSRARARRFVTYTRTSLEKHHPYEMLVPPNVGVDFDLIGFGPELRPAEPGTPMHPDDAALLVDAADDGAKKCGGRRVRGRAERGLTRRRRGNQGHARAVRAVAAPDHVLQQ